LTIHWRPRRIAIIGIGLLGGSVGLAARRAWPDIEIVGLSRSTRSAEAAIRCGAATEMGEDLEGVVADADLVCVGTPVSMIADHAIRAAAAGPVGAIITDVGSTKGLIVEKVCENRLAAEKFVGSHPIAGGDKSGPEFAQADLFDHRVVVVTPVGSTDQDRLSRVTSFWQQLGAVVVQTSPREHDQHLAATSHLPHLVAASLASLLPPEAVPFAGMGWRDTTRVADGDPSMWAAICRENPGEIAQNLTQMIDALTRLRSSILTDDSDAIEQFLQLARSKRQKVKGQ
jgi:prephenate dehydrogenase